MKQKVNLVRGWNMAGIDNVKRSSWRMPVTNSFDMNVGDLMPFYVQEVYPGDTFKNDTHILARLSTPLAPTMDRLKLKWYYFFVPNRLLWDNWRYFMGESKQAWTDDTVYQVPGLNLYGSNLNYVINYTHASSIFERTRLLDALGYPVITSDTNLTGAGHFVNSLPIRAYNTIWNEWFRDENLQDPLLLNTGNSASDDFTKARLLKANKTHDYFTSALPAPQKGPSVFIPFNDMPVRGRANESSPDSEEAPITLQAITGGAAISSVSLQVGQDEFLTGGTPSGTVASNPYRFANLYATSDGSGATINAFRLAVAIQQIYETDARGGTRYIEMIKAHFGVDSPDSRQQRPEFLGGGSTYVDINQVASTADTDARIGELGAYGQSHSSSADYNKSFTEHGLIIGLCVARYDHTYSQGIEKFLSRRDRFDYYFPQLANLGEQPIFTKEIFVGNDVGPEEVFGYQEAWADLRYRPNRVSGKFRPNLIQNLGIWTYADNYTTKPLLSADWIKEDKTNVERTLSLTSETGASNLLINVLNDIKVTRVMPLYSIPGLRKI